MNSRLQQLASSLCEESFNGLPPKLSIDPSTVTSPMLKWSDVLTRARGSNPAPDSRVSKSAVEWHKMLNPEQYRVTREAGTERAFSSEMCSLFEPGVYGCLCCGTRLFNAAQ